VALSVSPVEFADIQGLRMPLRIYRFQQDRNSISVLYTRWEDKALEQAFASEGVTRLNRLQSIWRGRGNHGQRVLSLALWGAGDAEGARKQLLAQLHRLLSVGPPLRE
jgi:hypothetical protein